MSGILPDDKKYMQRALQQAAASVAEGGFPAGAVLVKDRKIIGEGLSLGQKLHDPTSHGDIAAIRQACRTLQKSALSGATLYTSLQPCAMCFGASMNSGVVRIVFACAQAKVSPDYYGGSYSITTMNAELTYPIELVHCKELENESLTLVHNWEKTAVQSRHEA